MRLLKPRYWHELFEAGVFLKALNSVWELLGGVFLLTFARGTLPRIVVFFSRSELIGDHDRDDLVFRFVDTQLVHLLMVNTRTFVAIYLLFHGIVNAFLSYNLFRNRLWAYPFAITFASLFLVYQIYRLAHTHSGILLTVSIFDVCFIILTWHEYRHQKGKLPHVVAS
jgi:uncharacterized membrane protein